MFLGIAAVFLPLLAHSFEDQEFTEAVDQFSETRGISLFQSGRSVTPAVVSKVPGAKLNDVFVDDFAMLEDEFDSTHAELPEEVIVPKQTPMSIFEDSSVADSSCTDNFIYIEAILVIAVFAVASQLFKQTSSRHGQRTQLERQAEAKAQEQQACVAPKPIVVATPPKSFAALEQAVRSGDEAACIQLLREGGRYAVRQEDACGCTALHIAAHCGHLKMAKLLLDHAAKVDAQEAWDETPLHMAARCGSVEVCELLLQHRADINAVNGNGWTPLLVAGEAKQEAACEFLLSKGAGAGEVEDTEIPHLVNALLLRRMFVGAVPHPDLEVPASDSEFTQAEAGDDDDDDDDVHSANSF